MSPPITHNCQSDIGSRWSKNFIPKSSTDSKSLLSRAEQINDKMKQVGTLGGEGGLMLFWDGVESQAYECMKLNIIFIM